MNKHNSKILKNKDIAIDTSTKHVNKRQKILVPIYPAITLKHFIL